MEVAMLAYALFTCCVVSAANYPSPPGPYLPVTSSDLANVQSFRNDQPLVGTYFFYWYNIYTKEHFLNHDGSDALVDHPADEKDYSYTSAAWWTRELRDVKAAGIDFILPVYWGVPGYDSWSFQGLPPLVEAWDTLAALGEEPPRVGLFYDTSTLQHNPAGYHVDLTTQAGKEWFYHTVRDYFSWIPPRMWAATDGQPIVFLYSAAFAANQDPAAFDYLYDAFERDFGCRPYLVKERSWQGKADATYAWGGALSPKWYDVVALGPGYDHHAVPGRKPLVVEREGGDFYERVWRALLAQHPQNRSRIVMVETWNELHEGTDICETKEYGRQYIELTATYAAMFKAGEQVAITGPYTQADRVSWDGVDGEQGMTLLNTGDGLIAPVEVEGVPSVRTQPSQHSGRYLYVALDDSFLYDQEVSVQIELTYLDSGCSEIRLEYDSRDPEGSAYGGAFKLGGQQTIGDSGHWRTITFTVDDGRFVNRCNGADFRFAVLGGELTVQRIVVMK